MNIQVKNLEHLKSLAMNINGDFTDFYILLAYGFAKSSKRIIFYSDVNEFYIINEIDESYQEVKTSELSMKTNLIEAINSKSLFITI